MRAGLRSAAAPSHHLVGTYQREIGFVEIAQAPRHRDVPLNVENILAGLGTPRLTTERIHGKNRHFTAQFIAS
jgi:hypothetical protein